MAELQVWRTRAEQLDQIQPISSRRTTASITDMPAALSLRQGM
jgi:hypothetical protein